MRGQQKSCMATGHTHSIHTIYTHYTNIIQTLYTHCTNIIHTLYRLYCFILYRLRAPAAVLKGPQMLYSMENKFNLNSESPPWLGSSLAWTNKSLCVIRCQACAAHTAAYWCSLHIAFSAPSGGRHCSGDSLFKELFVNVNQCPV